MCKYTYKILELKIGTGYENDGNVFVAWVLLTRIILRLKLKLWHINPWSDQIWNTVQVSGHLTQKN